MVAETTLGGKPLLDYETRQLLRRAIDQARRKLGRPCLRCRKPVELQVHMTRLCPGCKEIAATDPAEASWARG